MKSSVYVALVSLSLFGLPARADTHYVNLASTSPVHPYTGWSTAATNIQDAVDSAVDGDVVLVTNGVYDSGTRVTPGYSLLNRVVVTNNITLRSVNGPAVTAIKGQGPRGLDAVRCVYMSTGTLDGFALTNGFTHPFGSSDQDQSGGGAYCDGGILTNCVLSGNFAQCLGGGAYGGRLYNCRLSGNSSDDGGGAGNATLYDCTVVSNIAGLGGGAYGGTLHNCILNGNSVETQGGGAIFATLYNCTLTGNYVFFDGGGGAAFSTLWDCTLAGNSADIGGGVQGGTLYNCVLKNNSASHYSGGAECANLENCTLVGNSPGGARGGRLNNCIVYYNRSGPDTSDASCTNSCASNLTHGVNGNITNAPSFMNTNGWADLRLRYESPCIDAGTNKAWMSGSTDFSGSPRLVGARVDMGAYEYDGTIYDSDRDGLTDNQECSTTHTSPLKTDTDDDGHTDREEFIADTDGNNSNDTFRITTVLTGPPVEVQFPSSTNRLYTLWWTTNLLSGVWTNAAGTPPHRGAGGTDSLTLADPVPREIFYRVEARIPE